MGENSAVLTSTNCATLFSPIQHTPTLLLTQKSRRHEKTENTGHSSLVTVLSLMIKYGLALSSHPLLPAPHDCNIIKPLQRIYRQILALFFFPQIKVREAMNYHMQFPTLPQVAYLFPKYESSLFIIMPETEKPMIR